MKKLLALLAVVALLLTCTVMGVGTVASAAEESPEEDFIVIDGVLEGYSGAGGDIVIPASLGVTEIAAQAFSNNTDIASVVIPEGVEIVGYWSFRGCENIEFIELPYSLEELAEHCFSSASITEIVIPGNVEVVGYGAFSGCQYLEKVTLSYGVKEIMVLAFGGCGVGDVIFPETVELICGGSFTNNKNATVGKAKMIICNPDCEIGGWTKDSSKDAYAHSWHGYVLPFSSNAAATRYDIYVPKGSEVAQTLNENITKWNDADKAAGGSSLGGGHDSFDVKEKDADYFDIPENKEGYGKQPPAKTDDGDKNPTTGNEIGEDGGDDKNPTSGDSSGGSTNKNQGGGTQTIIQQGGSSTTTMLIIILCVFGGIILIAIIVVVILLATGKLGGKKAAPAAAPAINANDPEALKAALEALENKNKTIDANDPEALKAALAALENKDAE